jgi:hypothetical protein
VEYNREIGYQFNQTTLGPKDEFAPSIIDLGSNCVQGLSYEGGPGMILALDQRSEPNFL